MTEISKTEIIEHIDNSRYGLRGIGDRNFQADLESLYKTSKYPKRGDLYRYAWDEAHDRGYVAIMDLYEDLVELCVLDPEPNPFTLECNQYPGLAKIIEESGEVLQIIGKLIATGGKPNHWDGSDLNQELTCEFSDLAAALDYAVDKNAHNLDMDRIHNRKIQKLARFHQWGRKQPPLPGEET